MRVIRLNLDTQANNSEEIHSSEPSTPTKTMVVSEGGRSSCRSSGNRHVQPPVSPSLLCSLPQIPPPPASPRHRSLMEQLLVAKMEQAALQSSGSSTGCMLPGGGRMLMRTDSMDSTSSFGSSIGSDVCRCDDCLLGIADLYVQGPSEQASAMARKKVTFLFLFFDIKMLNWDFWK